MRANVFTVFNLILATFGTVTLLYGDWRDALFLGILVANTGVGITQEVRAKRALDRLSALVAPTATVMRDGRPRPLHVDEVVPGDLVRLAPGDQLVADGRSSRPKGWRWTSRFSAANPHQCAAGGRGGAVGLVCRRGTRLLRR